MTLRATTLMLAFTLLPLAASAGPLGSLDRTATKLGESAASLSNPSNGSLLQQLGSGSFQPASLQNLAGVLGYCQKEGYAPSTTDVVKNKLLGKLGVDNQPTRSTEYQQGLSGVLQDAQGGHFDLSTLKATVGKRVCGALVDKASSSLLGG
ncbi:MAG TPA: DUF2501 domain-containing protein [Nevskiaceae bacterium]